VSDKDSGAAPILHTLLGRKHCRNPLVFHQEHHELRRFAVARVAAEDVNIIRAFIECFAGFERDGLGASQLPPAFAGQGVFGRLGSREVTIWQ